MPANADLDALRLTTVLYVEDDALLVTLMTSTLRPLVKSLHIARDGQEGLLAFARFEPDIIITDIRMPHMDGFAMMAAVRGMRPDIPCIVTTSLDDADTLRQAIRLGATSYVPKPFTPSEVTAVLGRTAVAVRRAGELEKQLRLNELLLNSLPSPALLVHRDRRVILSANDSARELDLAEGQAVEETSLRQVFAAAGNEEDPYSVFYGGLRMEFKETPAFGRMWDIHLERLSEEIILFFALDITERQRAQDALQAEKAFIDAILENSFDGIAVVDPKGSILLFSPGMERLFGYSAAALPTIGAMAEAIGLDRAERARLAAAVFQANPVQPEHIFPFRHGDGKMRWCRFRVSRMPGGNIVINGQDFTGVKEAEERITHLALHDPLTSLPNRQLLQDRLERALGQSRRDGNLTALLFIDLDGFKAINDNFGHDIGDRVLVETARRLSAVLRDHDTVARLGGDEFLMVIPGIDHPDVAAAVVRRIEEALGEPMVFDGRVTTSIGASIGIGIFPLDGTNVEMLLRRADHDMYAVKRRNHALRPAEDMALDAAPGAS